MSRNIDGDVPITEIEDNFVVIDENLKIYWGPGQLVGQTISAPENWRAGEILNIPQVNRLTWAVLPQYDSDGYSDPTAPPPPPPPPPPGTLSYRFELQSISYDMSLTVDTLDTKDSYVSSDGGGSYTYVFPYNVNGTQDFLTSLRMKIYQAGTATLVYNGTVWDAAPTYMNRNGSRFVVWWSHFVDGGGTIFETFISSTLFSTGAGDPAQPPRCWVPASGGGFVSEVPTEALSYYGCSVSPGSPPVHPPPPNPPHP